MRRPPPPAAGLREAPPPPAAEQESLPAVLEALARELAGGKGAATVFGSRARGEAHAGSDIDILLRDVDEEGRWETRSRIRELCDGFGLRAEIVSDAHADPAFVERIRAGGIGVGADGVVPRLPDPWPPPPGEWTDRGMPGWLARPLRHGAENMARGAFLVDMAVGTKLDEADRHLEGAIVFQALREAVEGIGRGLARVLAALGEGEGDSPLAGELGTVSAATRPFMSYATGVGRLRPPFAPRLRGSLLSLADAARAARLNGPDEQRAMHADLRMDAACLAGAALQDSFAEWLRALGAPAGFPEANREAAAEAARR